MDTISRYLFPKEMRDIFLPSISQIEDNPGTVIVEYKKGRYFAYQTYSCEAGYNGTKDLGNATPVKNREFLKDKKYIILPSVNDLKQIKKQFNVLNSLKSKKPLMQTSGFMTNEEFIEAVDKVSKGLESKLI